MAHLFRVELILNDGYIMIKNSALSPTSSATNTIYGSANLKANTNFADVTSDDARDKALV
ncbi:hypothetical protein ACFLT8_06895 [Chloroflexota bacterium]